MLHAQESHQPPGVGGHSLAEEHYLRDVFSLGDQRPVVTSQAIYSSDNVKLLKEGVRISSALLERVLRHKLIPPIEQCLSVEGGVDRASLTADVTRLLTSDERFQSISEDVSVDRLLQALQRMPLPLALAFKLTLAREQRPHLYAHSLDVALLALYLQSLECEGDADLTTAAAAGLYHDLGILHIPSEVLSLGKQLTEANRHFLYAHPILGKFIVQEYPELRPCIGTAILEHHERVDGSGYPVGLVGSAISRLGKILMVADSGAALFKGRSRGQGSVSLRLLRRKFDPVVLDHAYRLLGAFGNRDDHAASMDADAAVHRLGAIANVLSEWNHIRTTLSEHSAEAMRGPLIWLINERVTAFERSLRESGFDADQLDYFVASAASDELAVEEIVEIANEATWQIKDIVLEVQRHWAEEAPIEGELLSVAAWLAKAEDRLQLNAKDG